jgi:hypothetical protein
VLSFREESLYVTIFYSGEEYVLPFSCRGGCRAGFRVVSLHAECLCGIDGLVSGFKVCGTLGHYHHVGLEDPFGQVAEPACRQEMVFEYGTAVVHQHDRHGRGEPAVLECVVKDYQVLRHDVLVNAPPGLL